VLVLRGVVSWFNLSPRRVIMQNTQSVRTYHKPLTVANSVCWAIRYEGFNALQFKDVSRCRIIQFELYIKGTYQ